MPQSLMANVFTRGRFDVRCEMIAQKVRERFGALGVTCELLKRLKDDGSEFILGVNGVEVAVLYMCTPMPQEAFRRSDAELLNKQNSLTNHRAHAVVAAFREVQGHSAKLKAALAVLRVASVLSESPKASAVFWVPAETLTEAATFRQTLAPQSEQADMPISVLSCVIPYREGGSDGHDTRHGLAALGFHYFIGRDIEFDPVPFPMKDILNRYANFGSFLLQNGLVVKNGESCGLSSTDIIRIHLRDTGRISPHPVVAFEIEQLDNNLSDR